MEPQRSPHEARLHDIISGRTPIQLYLEFLFSHNHADLAVLKNAKAAVEARNSVCHSAVIFANAIMHAGTTVDAFLRDNLEWLSRATNWAKFGATAGLGVIHRGHLSQVGSCCSSTETCMLADAYMRDCCQITHSMRAPIIPSLYPLRM